MLQKCGRRTRPPALPGELDGVEALFLEGGADAGTGAVRDPGLIPFFLEAAAIGFEDAVVGLGGELRERSLAEVVDEAVLGGEDAEAGLADAEREIVVLEHADLVARVHFTDAVPKG